MAECEKICPVLAITMLKNKEDKTLAWVDDEVCHG